MLLATIPLGWLATKMKAAREQKAAVEAIRKARGEVQYDYQKFFLDTTSKPPGPMWLRKLLGDDMAVTVTFVSFVRKPGTAGDEATTP